MAASTEMRLPFVDPVVFRAAFSLTGEDKISGRTGMVALKQAARAWLPDEVINHSRGSSSALLRAWVGRDLRDFIDDELVHGELVGTGFIRPEALGGLIHDHRAGRQDRSKQIWQLLILEMWYRQASRAGVGV